MIRLTKPRLQAISAALDAALSGSGFDGGDFDGMDRDIFEAAAKWAAERFARMNEKPQRKVGRPPKPGGPMSDVERSRRYRARIAARNGRPQGKVGRPRRNAEAGGAS